MILSPGEKESKQTAELLEVLILEKSAQPQPHGCFIHGISDTTGVSHLGTLWTSTSVIENLLRLTRPAAQRKVDLAQTEKL